MLLNADTLRCTDALRQCFESAQPFRHVVVDRFLDESFCQQLIREFPSFDPARAVNERGEHGRKAVVGDLSRLGGAYGRFDALIRSPELLDWVSAVTGIPKLLYDPEYVGGGTHENLHGQDLDPHVDFNYHPSRRWHRRLNLIVFLNPQWQENWGGCLDLIHDPWMPEGVRESIVPLANRAVIFETTERSWHGFDRIQLPPEADGVSRRSIAVYFYTRERPPAETAASHATLYVQRPLSARIESGYTLDEEDVEELRVLIKRRDAQIKFLYEREMEFSQLIAGLVRSPSFRIGQVLTWPARAVRRLLRPN
jgi:hypothetical protein